jgi:hypothetical protein
MHSYRPWTLGPGPLAIAAALFWVASFSSSAAAQSGAAGGAGGPLEPVPPEVYSRDSEGNVTVRAVRLREPLVLDGRLDEDVYQQVPHLGAFIQQEPNEGAPASETTDAWIFFDDKNLYVSVRCWDSHPERILANELQRDAENIFRNDHITIALDTFHDKRNGFNFETNPIGGLRDQDVVDERFGSTDWNAIWNVKTRRFDQGWTAEFEIPFKSLRYRAGGLQTWGINIRRNIRWKNETQYLSPIPKSQSITRLSSAATLVGLELPDDRPPLELKPYAIAAMTDSRIGERVKRDGLRDAGFDFKYGLTKGLTADFTYNTDFAQVEADDQQINLTRFSLFFPEKRDFFLENQGIFQFGNTRNNFNGAENLSPVIFFSRRIGLTDGKEVPIVAGGRVSGRAGKYTVGALHIRSDEEPAVHATTTDFTVLRARRDVLRRSTIGVIATNRSSQFTSSSANQVFGTDANLAFYENILVQSNYTRSRTAGERRDQSSYYGKFTYGEDRYGFEAEHLYVGEGFNPEIGFLRRESFRRTYGQGRFSPRPANSRVVRKYSYEVRLDYITDPNNVMETREQAAAFRIDFANGDGLDFEYSDDYELLRDPFSIVSNVTIASGGYDFREVRTQYQLGPQRHVNGRLKLSSGTFYDGTKTEAGYQGRVELTPRLAVEPRITIDWIDLTAGSFTTRLVSARTVYAFSAHMAISALLQYASTSQTLSSNIRWRWEYRPGSDFYVVYSDGHDTVTRTGIPSLQNRSVALKLTRLFRF